MRRFFVAATILAISMMTGPSVLAQVGQPVTIDSAWCVVEPLTTEEVVALLPGGTPVPRADPAESVPPTGTPADAETTASVVEFVHQLSACTQAGNFLAIFALQTDAYTSATLGRMGYAADQLEGMLGAASAGDSGISTVTTINDVVVLDDGRIGVSATEEVTDPTGMVETFELYEYLVESDGSYLLDDYVLISVQ
jgi:hypothetical protein